MDRHKVLEALLMLSDGHYSKELSDMAGAIMVPSVLYCENGNEWHGSFKEYLERMNVDYYTALDHVKEVGELDEHTTHGDAYHAIASMLADYGLAIHGDMRMAYKLAYGYLTDPDK